LFRSFCETAIVNRLRIGHTRLTN